MMSEEHSGLVGGALDWGYMSESFQDYSWIQDFEADFP